jgi:hypothetical protein
MLAADVIVLVADISPPVKTLPPVTFEVVITGPVRLTKFPEYVGK